MQKLEVELVNICICDDSILLHNTVMTTFLSYTLNIDIETNDCILDYMQTYHSQPITIQQAVPMIYLHSLAGPCSSDETAHTLIVRYH